MPSHGVAPYRRLQLVTVTFQGYPYRAFVESFGDFVVSSRWLTAATQDFAPVQATHLGKVVLDAPPDGGASLDILSILRTNLASGKLPFPSDPTGLVFLVYSPFPCTGGGYHAWFPHAGYRIAYAVGGSCQDARSAEAVMTHEIAEVVSDPYWETQPDGGTVSGRHFDQGQLPWVGEVGDICNFAPVWTEGDYQFTAAWSNQAAAGQGSPCVPDPSTDLYYNVSPSPSGPQTVPAGSSATFTLTGWSTAAINGWTLRVLPDNYAPQDFNTSPVLSGRTIKNGETVTLTLRVPAGTPPGKQTTVRVQSARGASVDGVTGFSNDWPLQIRSQ